MLERVTVYELGAETAPLAELLSGLETPLLPLEDVHEQAQWIDTFDWRLWEKGLTLRWWSASGESRGTLMLCSRQGSVLYTVVVDECPIWATDLPHSPFRTQLENLVHPRRLFHRASFKVRHRQWGVVDQDSKTMCRLDLLSDGVSSSSPGKAAVPVLLRVSEVLGYERAYAMVTSCLAERLPPASIRDGPDETELIFRAAGVTPGSYSSKLGVDLLPQMPTVEAVRTICRVLLETLRLNEEGVRSDWDIEFLHDFRVAVRRTRALLAEFKDVLPGASSSGFRAEFGWLGRETGPLRDLDVYVEQVRRYEEGLVADLPGLQGLLPYLERCRGGEVTVLRKVLDSTRYRKLLSRWERYLDRADAASSEEGKSPVLVTAADRIWKSYRRIRKKRERLGDHATPEDLHRLRIDCKKLRYLLESFRSLFDESEVRQSIKSLKLLQDCLGKFNDLQVQQGRLEKYAQETIQSGECDAAVFLAVGRFVERLVVLQQQERDGFRERFAEFAAAESEARFERLFKRVREDAGD